MRVSSILKRIKSVLCPETWCCAVRFNASEDACILNDRNTPFTVLPDSYRYWSADPFLILRNGKYYLFFEMFDRMKRKGLLGCREISESGCSKMKVIYECDCHLSFPFIYEKDGIYYIIPESNKSGELFRLKCTEFPYKWEKEAVIAKQRLVDTVVFCHDETCYYISEEVDDRNVFDRLDLFYDNSGTFTACSSNPVKRDADTARGAGKVFEYDGSYVRPSQNCGASYGACLNFNKIKSISKNGYEESLVLSVSPQDIPFDKADDFIGIHTYNQLGRVETVDLKIPGRFNFLNIFGVFYRLLKRFL